MIVCEADGVGSTERPFVTSHLRSRPYTSKLSGQFVQFRALDNAQGSQAWAIFMTTSPRWEMTNLSGMSFLHCELYGDLW